MSAGKQIRLLLVIVAVGMAAILLFSPKSEQPNAMQALAERDDTATVKGPFEDGSVVPVFHPVKILSRGYLDPRSRLSGFTVVYEEYPYTDPPTYQAQTEAFQAIASNEERWWNDSLAYVYWRTLVSPLHDTKLCPLLIDGPVGRHMLMQKEAVVRGGYHKRSTKLY